jgi:hypothetical protein
VIASIVRWLALLACAFVVLSFLYFAVNQTSTASKNSIAAIDNRAGVKADEATKVPNPSRRVEKVREREDDKLHEFVDDVDDVLLSPFTGISHSSSVWVRRLVPLGLALLIYGVLGLYVARSLGLRRY